MEITFLLGNGFDIGLGLHSRYEDFYKIYCEERESDSRCVKKFKEDLRKRNTGTGETRFGHVIDWSDFEKAIGEYTIAFSNETYKDFIEIFRDFYEHFNQYLEAEEKNWDCSNQAAIGKMMSTAIKRYYDLQPIERNDVQTICDSLNGTQIFHFISFNYTNTIDICASILRETLKSDSKRSVGQVLHIHGTIYEGMVMGLNDATQISNPDFVKNKAIVSELIKPEQNKIMKSNNERNAKSLISNSTIVCIYGMSIGETDKLWWMHIAKWLSGSIQRRLIILIHDPKYDKRFPHRRREMINIYEQKLFSVLEYSTASTVKEQIIFGFNNDIFALSQAKKDEPQMNTPPMPLTASM